MLSIVNGAGVAVFVAVEDAVAVKGMSVGVMVTVGVSVIGVGEPGVNVRVGRGVSDSIVAEGRGVAVDVGNIGAPTSLQPKSIDAPINPANGTGGTCSPFAAIN